MRGYPDKGPRLENCAYGASPVGTAATREAQMDDAQTRPRTLDLPDRVRLARALHAHGLGLIRLPGLTSRPCLGYQHGCTCGCKAKPDPAPEQPAQPWEPRAAKRAA